MDSELSDNTITELKKEYDIKKGLNATFSEKVEYEYPVGTKFTSYFVKTFNNVEPYNFEFEEHPEVDHNLNDDEAKIVINNTNGYLIDIIGNPIHSMSISNNYAEFDMRLKRIPDNIYFSFGREEENIRRYVLLKDIGENFSKSFDYESLPITEDLITITYPQNSKVSVGVFGALESDPNNFFAKLSTARFNEGLSSFICNGPIGLFQKFRVNTTLEIGEEKFKTIEIGNSINENYSKPNLSFQVLNNSLNNYEIASSSTFDYYRVLLFYENKAENYDITWEVFGKSEADIKFKIPKILDMFELNNMTVNVDDLNIILTSIIKTKGIESYKDFIISRIDSESKERKQISKSESLIKQTF